LVDNEELQTIYTSLSVINSAKSNNQAYTCFSQYHQELTSFSDSGEFDAFIIMKLEEAYSLVYYNWESIHLYSYD